MFVELGMARPQGHTAALDGAVLSGFAVVDASDAPRGTIKMSQGATFKS
jgi:hypothetical protein